MTVNGLLTVACNRGRIENIVVRLLGKHGAIRPMAVAGYRLEELNGHYFLALRRASATQPEASAAPLLRDRGTGLYDADALADLVSGELETGRLTGQQMTFFAADGFDQLRDRMGGAAERELLATVGSLLRANSFNGDAAGRIAPDRFGLLHNPDLDISSLAKQLSSVIRHVDGDNTGVAIHSATVDIDNSSLDEHDVAKALVYTINRFRHLNPADFTLKSLSASISTLAREAVETVASFRRAIAQDEFDIAFQPILEVRTGQIHHYEALARFRNGTGSRTPYEQITFAEETGLIAEFDLAMARKVIRWLGSIPPTNRHDVCVAVNISGASVSSLAYLSELDVLLNDNLWARGRLMFEITESARMEQLGPANTFIQRLRSNGYPVCLDDFGAGAANFEYLSRLEVDIVKLDGTAIRNARQGHKGKAFLKALVGLCHELNVATIAEMVEDEPAFDFVRQCGVEYVQGHLFGEPTGDISRFIHGLPAGMAR